MHVLLSQTKDLVKKEKHFTYLILKNLKNIEENKLYCDLGYSSLHSYLEKELGYSSAESAIRVANVKLMKRSALACEKIKAGELNLTQGSQLFCAFSRSRVDAKTRKMDEVLSLIIGKSTRESEKIIRSFFEIKGIYEEKVILNGRLKEKLERLRKIYEDKSFTEMIEIMVDEKLMEKRTPPRADRERPAKENMIEKNHFGGDRGGMVVDKKIPIENLPFEDFLVKALPFEEFLVKESSITEEEDKEVVEKDIVGERSLDKKILTKEMSIKKVSKQEPLLPIKNIEKPKSRYIPITLRRAILVRAQKRCEYVSGNGVHCNERRNLEFEHTHPYSQGGGHTLENLKLYCRNHNQRQGIIKIDRYLDMMRR